MANFEVNCLLLNDGEVGHGVAVVVAAVAAAVASAGAALAALGEGRNRAAGEHCNIVHLNTQSEKVRLTQNSWIVFIHIGLGYVSAAQ